MKMKMNFSEALLLSILGVTRWQRLKTRSFCATSIFISQICRNQVKEHRFSIILSSNFNNFQPIAETCEHGSRNFMTLANISDFFSLST